MIMGLGCGSCGSGGSSDSLWLSPGGPGSGGTKNVVQPGTPRPDFKQVFTVTTSKKTIRYDSLAEAQIAASVSNGKLAILQEPWPDATQGVTT